MPRHHVQPSESTVRFGTVTSSTEDANEPEIRDLAERYVDALNNRDEVALMALNCAKRPGLYLIAADGQTVTITDEFERAPWRTGATSA